MKKSPLLKEALALIPCSVDEDMALEEDSGVEGDKILWEEALGIGEAMDMEEEGEEDLEVEEVEEDIMVEEVALVVIKVEVEGMEVGVAVLVNKVMDSVEEVAETTLEVEMKAREGVLAWEEGGEDLVNRTLLATIVVTKMFGGGFVYVIISCKSQ